MIGESFGRFEILSLLGTGGMGEVYRALDSTLHRQVALKVLPRALASDPERLARFDREARLLAQLNHPRIAAIHSMETDGETPFLVLELVEGESLRERLVEGPLTMEAALRVAKQVAEALAAAHDAGIVHRDLKPANIMLSPDSLDVKVLDFGIAKAAASENLDDRERREELTRTGVLLGTTAYLSPEQLRGEFSDHRADIWAFGCLLFELLAGERPFAKSTPAATVAAILSEDPDWGRLPPRIPQRVRTLVRRCLERDPDLRVPNMQDALAELEAALRPGGTLRRSPPVTGRRALIGLGAVATLVVLAMATASLRGRAGSAGEAVAGVLDYIAVLPFENRSGDPGQEYVAAAMTDQLTTSLGAIPNLRVLGRESARTLASSDESPVTLALGQEIDALVTGAVFTVAEDVRVTVELVDTRTGDQRWSRSYTGTAGEIFALTDSTARSVGREIGVLAATGAAVPDAIQGVAGRPSSAPRPATAPRERDPQALNAYSLGTYYMQDYTEDALTRAVEAFERAIELDPGLAPAHAALGRSYVLLVLRSALPADEYLPLAKQEIDLAMTLDSLDADVLAAAAVYATAVENDWASARNLYRRALQLNPSSGDAWHGYSELLSASLEQDSALETSYVYRRVEPLTRGPWYHLANVHRNRREWANVVAVADSGLAIYPDYLPLRTVRARALRRLGRVSEATDELERLVQLSDDPIARAALVWAYIDMGEPERARAIERELEERGSLRWLAAVRGALGDLDGAFEALEAALDAAPVSSGGLTAASEFDPLRTEPARWRRLLERAGVPADVIVRAMEAAGSTEPAVPGEAPR